MTYPSLEMGQNVAHKCSIKPLVTLSRLGGDLMNEDEIDKASFLNGTCGPDLTAFARLLQHISLGWVSVCHIL